MGCFMYQYPKRILTIEQQMQSYIDAGMEITSRKNVEKALQSVGFYRLRGYSFHLYDNSTKKYIPGTKFDDVFQLYQFDRELSALIFSMISKIEIALRVRLVEALLIHGDALILRDSSIFKEKKMYWQNMSTIASEIARSNDVFIKHNFDNHEGEVPVWAVVEVLSFGTLSKIIKNLKTGTGSTYSILASNYKYIDLWRDIEIMIKILFICHGSILKSPQKASKINGSAEQKGAYYTTTTPFLKAP